MLGKTGEMPLQVALRWQLIEEKARIKLKCLYPRNWSALK
jgi:hypothetical protein